MKTSTYMKITDCPVIPDRTAPENSMLLTVYVKRPEEGHLYLCATAYTRYRGRYIAGLFILLDMFFRPSPKYRHLFKCKGNKP